MAILGHETQLEEEEQQQQHDRQHAEELESLQELFLELANHYRELTQLKLPTEWFLRHREPRWGQF